MDKLPSSNAPALLTRHCDDCSGLSRLSAKEAGILMTQLKGWSLGEATLEKEFVFSNFVKALDWVNRVGKLAESEGHHPDILLHDYKKVRISLWTHTICGLTENDFILAAKIDEI